MATDEQKKRNLVRLMTLMIEGMAKALYDLFGETALATMNEVGKDILQIMEQEMGLELAGETPEDVLTEIGRIYADEMGFIESFRVESNGGREIALIVDRCQGWNLTQAILKHGVDIPFTCPIMNVGEAALLRLGKHAHRRIEPIPETHGSRIVYTFED